MSGNPLGRPPKNLSLEAKRQALEDEGIRNCIEGKFGQGKRRFNLSRIMTKLPSTSATTVALIFLVMNLSTLFKETLCLFLCLFFAKKLFWGFMITKNYSLDMCR